MKPSFKAVKVKEEIIPMRDINNLKLLKIYHRMLKQVKGTEKPKIYPDF